MDYFRELLDRYTNRTATKEEKEAFFALLESGQYDDLIITESVRELVNAELGQASEDDMILHDSRKKIYASLLQRNRIPTRLNVAPFYTMRSRLWMAAAVITVALVAYSWMMVKKDMIAPIQVAVQQEGLKPAVYSGKQVVDLPDGTRVILNENSELSYGQSFGILNREVTLIGEASFDVTHDPSSPFIVHTGKVNTKVLGTAFNISAYAGQDRIIVTVLRGLVEVSDNQQNYGKISSDEQLSLNTTTYDFVRKTTKAEEAVVWQSNFLIFDDVTLEEVMVRVGKKFQVNITFDNPALKNCKFYGSFLNDESLTDILTMMGPVLDIDYKVEDGNVLISGKGCN